MRVTAGFVILFVGNLINLIPSLTRRGILFAVPVSPDVRNGPLARRSIALFHWLVAGVTLLCLCAILVSPVALMEPLVVAGLVLILLAAVFGFVWQNRRLAPFAVEPARTREVDLSRAQERAPWFTWFGVGPLLIPAAAALFLRFNWDNIPARFPVHWGLSGLPDRWSERSVTAVYGPLLIAVELCAWIVILALALWFGARRSRLRRIVMGSLIAVDYSLGLVFAAFSIKPVVDIPLWIPAALPLVVVIPMLVVMAREVSSSAAWPVEPTPNDCWKGGVIYYNPNDAALMVEKRTGLGYTVNFGNRWSWALVLGLGVVASSSFLLL